MKKKTGFIIRNVAVRRILIWAVLAATFSASTIAAFLLRFDFNIPSFYLRYIAFALAIWLPIKFVVFYAAKLDRGFWRYVSAFDLVRIAVANLIASIIGFFLIRWLAPHGFPRSLYVLDLMVCFFATCALRLLARATSRLSSFGRSSGAHLKRTLIYGAGDAGNTLLREIRNNSKLAYRVCGFIDDDAAKLGLRIAGVQVLGNGDAISTIAEKRRIDNVLIAIPSATGHEMTRILELCQATGVEFKTVPGLDEVIEGRGLAGQIRQVAVEDLLGRTPVHLEETLIKSSLEGKIVLVTGAAGSIGSELCRQIARFHPAGIVGFEIAESGLFEIDREMHEAFPQISFYPEIGSIQNRERLNEVFRHYRPSAVYHAAAYKHVPLMETHAFEAIENNVFGTYNVALAAAEHGVEDFLLISSDKAVRPTNVMGATKRIAELVLMALQNGRTKYVAVRFGNVLGSNGSVIPTFKKQIASGGPVTVTHPEMRRFFMTIPEACQLVLQALAIGSGGQICVLDMGQPVRIIDLARHLILLSGLRPEEDIKIEFTGMRPGEKLSEELTTMLEDTVPSKHDKIRIFVGNGVQVGDVHTALADLRDICEMREIGRLVIALKELVPDYSPSVHLLKRVMNHEERGRFAVDMN
ncbi:MAG TPA: nucleoside-diphosphate sugar epimerase/dehydratase [Terracidiphilus sp.]|nr:nucleoside-diphosphate sugar epimerase/dehydratase [Terracidiphilus sp.]